MKYLIYGSLMLTGYALTFGMFPLLLPVWLGIDIVLIFVLGIAQVTKDYTGFIIGICIGILIDIFISPAFGIYTLIYCANGYIYAKICFKTQNDNVLIAIIVIFFSYILKDILLMAYGIIYGTVFPFWTMLWRMTLPSALLTGLSGFVGYLLVLKIHELRVLKIHRELDFLRSYKEEYDWLGNWFEQFK